MGVPPALAPGDEGWHPPGPEPRWSEWWYFDFASPDGSVGGYVRVGRYPNLGVVWYWACLAGPRRPAVMVIDHEVRPPVREGSLELRASGLWADHNCETPFEHWSVGLEASAVSLDDPLDAYRGSLGQPVPLGFDLEWETDGEVFAHPPPLDGYEVPCRVHGEVLVGRERLELDGVGQRNHAWGGDDRWAGTWCWTAFHVEGGSHHLLEVAPGSSRAIGYRQLPGSGPVEVLEGSVAWTEGRERLPRQIDLTAAGERIGVTPLVWAPVLVEGPGGRRTRLPRALARFEGAAGPGVGWVEVNQPE
ncbi:DUF7064 domain-containing protein [Rhabdothermincola sediminis]|uniref:DUF7064 domain-containing protein n=1 Tax=Rhabdothermincola sediminis TaxID=2751370 RepID=UPI001AA0A53B|nr:hypothetical protein [Rhabdothermincola sediminis]